MSFFDFFTVLHDYLLWENPDVLGFSTRCVTLEWPADCSSYGQNQVLDGDIPPECESGYRPQDYDHSDDALVEIEVPAGAESDADIQGVLDSDLLIGSGGFFCGGFWCRGRVFRCTFGLDCVECIIAEENVRGAVKLSSVGLAGDDHQFSRARWHQVSGLECFPENWLTDSFPARCCEHALYDSYRFIPFLICCHEISPELVRLWCWSNLAIFALFIFVFGHISSFRVRGGRSPPHVNTRYLIPQSHTGVGVQIVAVGVGVIVGRGALMALVGVAVGVAVGTVVGAVVMLLLHPTVLPPLAALLPTITMMQSPALMTVWGCGVAGTSVFAGTGELVGAGVLVGVGVVSAVGWQSLPNRSILNSNTPTPNSVRPHGVGGGVGGSKEPTIIAADPTITSSRIPMTIPNAIFLNNMVCSFF